MRGRGGALACVWAAVLGLATEADAQSRTYPAGVGSVSLGYQHISNTGHRLSDGFLDAGPGGLSVSQALMAEVAYGLSDRLTVALGLPLVATRYTGNGFTPFPLQPVDDGRWHAAFQDVGVGAYYEAFSRGAFALVPSVTVVLPSHDYAYRGEAVVGRRLRELQVEVSAARTLEEISARLAVDASYGYAIVEKALAGVPDNRSNATLGIGYLVTPKLHASGAVRWQRTHGGLRVGSPTSARPGEIDTPARVAQHDRLLRDNHVHLEGALSFSAGRVDLSGSYLHFLSGTDTHAGRAITLGVTWFFGAVR